MHTNYQPERTGNVKSFAKAHLYRWLKRLPETVSRRERSVLKALVRVANVDGVAKVSWDAIGQETGYSRRAIAQAVSSLRTKGLIGSQRNYNRRGKRTASTYTLNIAQEPIKTVAQEGPTKCTLCTPITTDLRESEYQPGEDLDSTLEEDTGPPPAGPAWWLAHRVPDPFPEDQPAPWDDLPHRGALQ